MGYKKFKRRMLTLADEDSVTPQMKHQCHGFAAMRT